jgi:hypothetical protein
MSSNMTIYIRLSSSDGGHGGKESDNVELHLDGFVWLCLVLELIEGGWKKEVEFEKWLFEKAYLSLKSVGLKECRLIVDEERSQDLHEEDSYMYQNPPIIQATARSR